MAGGDWLVRYPGTLLLITHDRDFLDGVATSIVHVDAQKLKTYTGNYSQFERERVLQLAMQQATYAMQQWQIAHLQSFVDAFVRGNQSEAGTKPNQGARTDGADAAAHVDSPFEFSFSGGGRDEAARQARGRYMAATSPPIIKISTGRSSAIASAPWSQQRAQVDAEGDCRRARAARGQATDHAGAAHRLFRPARGGSARRGRIAAVASRANRPFGARAGHAQFPRRFRLSR